MAWWSGHGSESLAPCSALAMPGRSRPSTPISSAGRCVARSPAGVVVRADDITHGLSFHEDTEYVAPTWPSTPHEQQMMVHLDIGTDDLDRAIAWALSCGARLADHQPQDGVRVLLDPAGHPFCLFPTERF